MNSLLLSFIFALTCFAMAFAATDAKPTIGATLTVKTPGSNSPTETETATIHREQLSTGRSWTWLYAELDPETQTWKPYYYERYLVIAEDGNEITFEMQSRDARLPLSEMTAHHRFVIDFRKCERAARNYRDRIFTIEMYTRDLGPGWTLVSKRHNSLAFTEKFNCKARAAWQKVTLRAGSSKDGQFHKVFGVPEYPNAPIDTWYLWEDARLKAVAFEKTFLPRAQYRFTLVVAE